MLVSMKVIWASDFKAHRLAIIDEVAATGLRLLIRKCGRSVAEFIRHMEGDKEYSIAPGKRLPG